MVVVGGRIVVVVVVVFVVVVVVVDVGGGVDFDETNRTLLNLLRPHLAQTYEHARMRDMFAERLAVMGGLLSAPGSM